MVSQTFLNRQSIIQEIIGDVKYPTIFNQFLNYSELIHFYNENEVGSHSMGLVIRRRDTNIRTKIRNPTYEKIRLLRGNSSNLQYHYFTLVKEENVDEFLKYYPEYLTKIKKYASIDNKFINNLYKNYISCYIKKNSRLNNFPKNYKTHMYYIHQIYLNQLKPNKKVVKYDIVEDYVKKLDNSLHMWSVNFDYY
jgi:hypothetical protein